MAGTSAGASFLSEHMIAFGEEGASPVAGSVRLAPGLGLTNRFIIDQHFRQRDRLGRLLTALAYNPFAIGIGLDEDTAAFIGPDNMIEVEGSGGITVVDASGIEFSSMDMVEEGQPVCLLGIWLHMSGGGHQLRPQPAQGFRRQIGPTQESARQPRRRNWRPAPARGRDTCASSTVPSTSGPSLYAHFPVIRLELDLGALEEWPTARLGSAFIDGLVQALPGLAEHGCSYGEPGGFIRRMREDEGTWLGHVLEHVAIELQNVAGEEVTFGKTRGTGKPGVYSVVYEYAQREEGIEAGELALRLLTSLLPPELQTPRIVSEDWDWPTARDEFIRYAQRRALGPSTASLVHAAEERGIPWLRLNSSR